MPPPEANLSLRPIRAEDEALLRWWANSQDMAEYFRRFPPGFAVRASAFDQHTWIVEADDKAVGLAALGDFDTFGRKCSFGVLLHPEARGNYLPFMLGKMAEYVFDYLAFNKAYCLTLTHREALHRKLEQAGLKREGVLRENVFWRGQYWDEVLHSLTAREYRAAMDK
jgi:RimJ/RimL family protein N-acetyltransferase